MDQHAAALEERAHQLTASHRYDEAWTAIEAVIEATGGLTPELHLAQANCLIGLERFREAYDVARNLLERGGEGVRPRALVLKAKVLRRSSRYVDDALAAALDGATAAALQGQESRSVEGEARLEAARIFAAKRCRGLAERELDLAKQLSPDAALVDYYRGAILMDLDDRIAANQIFNTLLDGDDQHRYYGRVGIAYLDYIMGEFDSALTQLDALAPIGAGDLWPRRIRAMVYQAQQRWGEAAEVLADVLTNSPSADYTRRDVYERANCLYNAGDLDAAIATWTELGDTDDVPDYHGQLAARMVHLLEDPASAEQSRRRLAAFPSVAQLRDHCGPASCELYLRFFGLSDSQVEIARAIKRPDGGTPVLRMRRYLDDAGFHTRRLEAELPLMKKLIDAGIPVIMEEAYSSSTHVAVAIGYDDRRQLLEVQDPMTHRVRETLYEDLAGLRNLSNHGALVGVPRQDSAKIALLDAIGATESRYIALVDEAWAALDGEDKSRGDELVAESIALHREYELAWIYRFRRARDLAKDEPTTENRVELHRILGEITALWPDDEWPQQLLGEALYFNDRAGEALVAFERARDRDPQDPYNWSMIADCNLVIGNNDAAYDALVEALGFDPGYIRANENIADLALQRGEMTLAWAINDVARELHDANPFNHAIHGQLLTSDDRKEEALAAYDRALELGPERPWIITLRAKLLGGMGRIDEADTVLTNLAAAHPNHSVGILIDLADLLYDADRHERAIAVCEELLAKEDVAAGHAIMGAALGKSGELDAALERLARALELRPTYAWAYTRKGELLFAADRHAEAIQSFAAALGMSGSARREYDLGDALVRAGYADSGTNYLRAAALHGSLDEPQLCRIGKLIVDTNTYNANRFFTEVEDHRPDDLAVLRAHAHTLLAVRWAPNTAAELLEKIVAMAPEDPYALVARGEELMSESLASEAEGEALLRAALSHDPDLVYARRVLADCLIDRGRFREALDLLDLCSNSGAETLARAGGLVGPSATSFHNLRLRVRALLGLGEIDAAREKIAAFVGEHADDRPNPGAMMLEYRIARCEWNWSAALELAEAISRETHERDDDGKLDRWEEERFECMARLGEVERALAFGETQAVDAASLGRLAYTAYRADQLDLAAEVANRALAFDPDESQALAVSARTVEVEGDNEGALEIWTHLGEIDSDWHVWQEQIARICLATGDLATATTRADEGVANGHLCPWAFAVRAQVRLLSGDRDGAVTYLDRAWALAAPEDRAHEAKDVWAIRAALAGDQVSAEAGFAAYLRDNAPISPADRTRIERVRASLRA